MKYTVIIFALFISACTIQSEVVKIPPNDLTEESNAEINEPDETNIINSASNEDANENSVANKSEYNGSVREMLITARNDTLFTPISFATVIIYDEDMVQVGDRTFSAFRDGTFTISSDLFTLNNNYVVEVINDKNISEIMEFEFSQTNKTLFNSNGLDIVMMRDERVTDIDEVKPVRMLFNNPRSIQIN